jgi:nicotinamidase-related amidase
MITCLGNQHFTSLISYADQDPIDHLEDRLMSATVLRRSDLGVLIIDAQPSFWGFAFGEDPERMEPILTRIEHLLKLADWMELPLIATFEHPVEKHGQLPDRLEEAFPVAGKRFTKRTYNCCLELTIREAIEALPVQQFAVAGAETDVCILQSVLGLLDMGYQVVLLEDCLFTTEPHPGPAMRRMYQAGAIPSTFKSLAYELAGSVDHTPWLETWIEKERDYSKPFYEDFGPLETFPQWEPKI